MLIIAVAEDDVKKFVKIQYELGTEQIPNIRFEHGMNILNLAID
jgi:hypothetical protein